MVVAAGKNRELSLSSLSTQASSSGSQFSRSSDRTTSKTSTEEPDKGALGQSKHRTRYGLLLGACAVLALAWSRYVSKRARQGTRWGPGRLALAASACAAGLARLAGVRGCSDFDRPDKITTRQHMLCYHPHGLYVMAPVLYFAKQPRDRTSPYYHQWNLVADACFSIPFFREWLLMINCRAADPKVLDSLLEQGDTVAVAPGGVHEQLATDPSVERIYFPPNLGFVRQAIKHGVPLVPLYSFGENQLYDVPDWSRRLSEFVKKHTGAGIPIGVGRWGLPILPRPGHLRLRLGEAVDVGPANPQPTDGHVREVFLRYCCELHRIFDENKDVALPADVAARGLQIVWREHSSEDLTGFGLAASLAEVSAEGPVAGDEVWSLNTAPAVTESTLAPASRIWTENQQSRL